MMALTREQLAQTLNNAVNHGEVDDEYYEAIMAHDAQLRADLDRSMRRQETLAENVNTGLLEIRDLKRRLAEAQGGTP